MWDVSIRSRLFEAGERAHASDRAAYLDSVSIRSRLFEAGEHPNRVDEQERGAFQSAPASLRRENPRCRPWCARFRRFQSAPASLRRENISVASFPYRLLRFQSAPASLRRENLRQSVQSLSEPMFQSAPASLRRENMCIYQFIPFSYVSIRSRLFEAGEPAAVRAESIGADVSIRSRLFEAGERARIMASELLIGGFNPLPPL